MEDRKYVDKQVQCVDCPNKFTLTAGEQEFFATKRDDFGKPMKEPRRCKGCRIKKKLQMASPFAEALRKSRSDRTWYSDKELLN